METENRSRDAHPNRASVRLANPIRIGGTEYRDEGPTASDYNTIVTAWMLWCSLLREFATTKSPLGETNERETWLGRINALAADVPGDLTPTFTALDELADILCEFMVDQPQFKAETFKTYLRSWKPGSHPTALLKGIILRTSQDETPESGYWYLSDCRTLAQWFKKLEVDRPDLDQKAEEDFISFEAELSGSLPRRVVDPQYLMLADRMNQLLLAHNMGYNNILFNGGLRGPVQPRHGPGVVADKRCKCQYDKYVHMAIDSRVEYLLRKGCGSSVKDYNPFAKESDNPVHRYNRFVSVPKNWKKKRSISAEPPGLQFFQQAIRSDLYHTIEHDGWWGRRLRFSDQSRSRALALKSSADGTYATIDLSSASDSVTKDLVSRVYKCTSLKLWLMATRSTTTVVNETVTIHDVKKFAPMGSATCFPVESMIFVLISELAIRDSMQGKYTYKPCCVYGDDIIVPTYAAETLCGYLQTLGFTVNTEKSFVRGYFREACGIEGWNGYPVNPLKLKKVYSLSRVGDGGSATFDDVHRIAHLVNALQMKGFHATSRLLLTDFLHREVRIGRSRVEAGNALVFTGEVARLVHGEIFSVCPTNFHLGARWVSGCPATDTSRLPLSRRAHGQNAYQVTEYRLLTWQKRPDERTKKILSRHSAEVEQLRYIKWLVARTMRPLAEQRADLVGCDTHGSGTFWLEPVTPDNPFREVEVGVTMVPTFTWSVSPSDMQFRHGRVQI